MRATYLSMWLDEDACITCDYCGCNMVTQSVKASGLVVCESCLDELHKAMREGIANDIEAHMTREHDIPPCWRPDGDTVCQLTLDDDCAGCVANRPVPYGVVS